MNEKTSSQSGPDPETEVLDTILPPTRSLDSLGTGKTQYPIGDVTWAGPAKAEVPLIDKVFDLGPVSKYAQAKLEEIQYAAVEKLRTREAAHLIDQMPAPTGPSYGPVTNSWKGEGVPTDILLRKLGRADFALFSRTHVVNCFWHFEGFFSIHEVQAYWRDLRRPSCEYRVYDVVKNELVDLDDNGKLVEPVEPEVREFEIPFAFHSGPNNKRAMEMYEASIEAFMETLHAIPGVDIETPTSELIEPDDVVGGLPQSMFMSGYQRALQDIAEGQVSIHEVFDSWHEMQRGDGQPVEEQQ